MRIGMTLNYAGGFKETVAELADYEEQRCGVPAINAMANGAELGDLLLSRIGLGERIARAAS